MFDILSAIEKKKQGKSLATGAWQDFVVGFATSALPDYQVSALMMAVCLRGLSDSETIELTEAIWRSGKTLDFGELGRPLVDKHSTGGVGDKVTPILVPLLLASGCAICKMSGRGLGHTGGTADKLESIPGFRTTLTETELDRQMHSIFGAMITQSNELAPVDKKLYGLRDVTGTVDSIPLIASSIMSKKLAGAAEVICLDVKVGDGSFFKTEVEALEFERIVKLIGVAFNRKVTAVFSPMDTPLGRAVGNALEIDEAIGVLEGGRFADCRDLVVNVIGLASEILLSTGLVADAASAEAQLYKFLENGKAYEVFESIIEAQGGSVSGFRSSLAELNRRERIEVKSVTAGRIGVIRARKIGEIARALGAGRFSVGDSIDPFAGIVLLKKPGDLIAADEPWALCYYDAAGVALKERFDTGKKEDIGNLIEKRMNEAMEIE